MRNRVYDANLFGTHGTLEIAPFAEAGRVAHQLAYNPVSELHPVGGVGFRGIAEPFVVGFVDVGYEPWYHAQRALVGWRLRLRKPA